jgi:ferredoxin-fold anticodon binding domain-containing protein
MSLPNHNQKLPRGITVASLMKQSNRNIVQTIVQDQIKIIDAKISTVHAGGGNQIDHELPTNFNLNNMNKSDAQTLIYSEIIMTYLNKGFSDTYIDLGLKPHLYVKWLNGMDATERERRQKIIKDHLLN